MSRCGSASGHSSSEVGLDNVNLNRSSVLPEQWTLPKAWNIEKREMFGNWKVDVQNQIKYINRKLGHSLKYYPPEHGPLQHVAEEEEEDLTKQLQIGRLQTGLKRV